jgi:RNA polymerase sigma-70 factor (ECF subfamily)
MSTDFERLIQRIRAGDADAAAELVRQFESAVRVAVRARLFDPDMRRQFDSLDICQSVLASFFVRAASGQYELQRPAQLVALLTKMAHHKLAWHVRHHLRQRRDVRRAECSQAETLISPSPDFDPARKAQGRELLEKTWERMTPQLREMAVRRVEGQTWEEVANSMGGTVDARKKQFHRGLDEIARELGIDDEF